MSTKKLSRTVIEGGRRNVWERRFSSKNLRAEERAYLSRVKLDLDNWDDEAEPELKPEGKEFSDKLSPMYRWLDSKVGQPWADVRSEVFTNFDTRTTAGRHITFDHLLREVVDSESGFDKFGRMTNPNIPVVSNGRPRYYGYSDYYIDEAGFLQKNPNSSGRSRSFYRRPYPTQQELADVVQWLGCSIIGKKDGALHWFVPTEGIWKADWEKAEYGYTSYLKYYLWDKGEHKVKRASYIIAGKQYYETRKEYSEYWNPIDIPFSYRQRAPLSKEEIEYFNSLTERTREAILAYGKGR